MPKQRLAIAVDGTAASGKSALSKELADRLGFAHLNTGLLYRAVALMVLDAHGDFDDEALVCSIMQRHSLVLDLNAARSSEVAIDGVTVTESLHTPQVSAGASKVAAHPGVRAALVEAQRHAFAGHGLVAEGRDMGTVIFPDAAVKFFVDARLDVRVQRRLQQMQGKGDGVTADLVRADIIERDERDSGRAIAPLKAAAGAQFIDNSDASLTDTVERMAAIVRANERASGEPSSA